MDPQVTRRLLGRAAEQRAFSPEAIEAALTLSGLRPGAAEWREFGLRAMKFCGVLSLAAGMIFLVAFNWQQLGLYGRFAMIELPLLAALIFAWVKGIDRLAGKLAVMLAVLLTGALLALFGETYQTGADAYELFLAWAALTLPWAVACRYEPCWAFWLVLLNAAAGLYSARPGRGLFFMLLESRLEWTPFSLLFMTDLAAYLALEALSRRTGWGFNGRWLRRGVMAVAMGCGTAVMVYRIFDSGRSKDAATGFEVVVFLAASAGLAAYAFWRKDDLFTFAVLALAAVVVTTTLISRAMIDQRAGIGALFLIALYVIASSAAAVKGVSYIGSTWKPEDAAK